MGHDGVERIGIGHRCEPIGALNTGAAQHILIQHLALNRPPAKEGMEVIERGIDLIDDRDVMSMLEQSVR
jgi:hypothetical protein